MNTRAPGTPANDGSANAQAITAALAMQHASPLPFSLDDCVTLLVLAGCLDDAGHVTRAARIRRLYSRIGSTVLDVRAGDDPDYPASLSVCDAADVWWSRSCRGLASDERERAHLLAFRLMRAVDYSAPRPARYEITPVGRYALLVDDGEPARPYSIERAERARDGGLVAGLVARVMRVVEGGKAVWPCGYRECIEHALGGDCGRRDGAYMPPREG